MKFKTIIDTGIKKKQINGARNQEIIWQVQETKEKFKVFIHSESYDNQSYARLYKWNDHDGWNLITSVNPNTDYPCGIAYQENYPPNIFIKIISDFKNIAKTFTNGTISLQPSGSS